MSLVPRFVRGGLYERTGLSALLVKDYLKMAGHLRSEFKSMLAHRIEDKLPRVEVPVLFVRGENDPIAPQHWVDELARLTRRGVTAVIPRSGHAVQFSAPDALVRVLVPFLSDLSSES